MGGRIALRPVDHAQSPRQQLTSGIPRLSTGGIVATRGTDIGNTLWRHYGWQTELSHHQWKTPLAVHPIFLKNPRRVEALVHLLLIALMAYHLIQRRYRQRLEPDAPVAEQRTTTETILRAFQSYTLRIESRPYGRVVHVNQLSARQRQILQRLNFPTPARVLSARLPHHLRQ